MTTDLATIQNQLPANIREQLAQQVASDIERLGNIGGKDAIRITQDKKFELPNGASQDTLEAVIVDFVYRNEYYPGQFNRKEIKPPTCFAISPVSANLTPDVTVVDKQSKTDCDDCQWNQWGSSPTGAGKACKNTVFLAVLPANATDEDEIWTLKTSPTAIRPFNGYVAKLGSTARVPVGAVVTKIFFDAASTYATVRFEVVGVNEAYEATSQRKEEARHRLLQAPDVSAVDEQT